MADSRGSRPSLLRLTTGENLVCRDFTDLALSHLLKAPARNLEPEILTLGLRQLVETPQKMVRKGSPLFQRQLQGADEKVFARHETIVSLASGVLKAAALCLGNRIPELARSVQPE